MREEQLSLLDVLGPLNVEARCPLQKSRLLESLTAERCKKDDSGNGGAVFMVEEKVLTTARE